MTAIRTFFNSYTPAILWWLTVLILICTPGQDLPKLGNWADAIGLDKIIHIIIFGLMAYFFMRPVAVKELTSDQKRNIFLRTSIAIAIWGLATEYIQEYWVINRTFDVFDFFADAVGATVAFFYSKHFLLR